MKTIRLNIEIDAETHRQLKIWVARYGTSIREFVKQLITEQLAQVPKSEKAKDANLSDL